MKNNLTLHSIKITNMDKEKEKKNISELKLEIYKEENLSSIKKIFESQTILKDEKNQKFYLNEEFQFLLNKKENFIILKLFIKNFETEEWEKIKMIILYDDLITKKDNLEFNLEIKKIKINIFFSLKNKEKKQFSEIKEFKKKKSDENYNYIELYNISQLFLKKISPLRKIKNDFEHFINEKHFLKDFILLKLFFIVIFRPRILFGILFIVFSGIFLIFDFKYFLRFFVIKNISYYFQNTESKSDELKENFKFIHDQQLMLINLSEFLRKNLFSKNRKIYFKFFRFHIKIICIILFFLAFFYHHKIFLCILPIYFFLRKYKDILSENFFFQNLIFSKSYNLLNTKEISKILKTIFFYKFKKNQEKLKKRFFFFENERWFPTKGFQKKTLLFERQITTDKNGEKNINKKYFDLKNWKWENEWSIMINEETDDEGWTYAKSFFSGFKKKNQVFCTVRRRLYIRSCTLG